MMPPMAARLGDTGAAAPGFGWLLRQQGLDGLPDIVVDEGLDGHGRKDATRVLKHPLVVCHASNAG